MIYHGSKDNDLSELPEVVRQTIDYLMPHKRKFDSIAVMGISGEIVGIPVALALGKPIVIIRKEGIQSHSYGLPIVNVRNVGKRCLFIDDFIAGGKTIRRVISVIEDGTKAKVVNAFLYADASFFITGMKSKKELDKYRQV